MAFKKTLVVALGFFCFGGSTNGQLSITSTGTTFKIDFDTNLSGVNEGQFDGSGYHPSPSLGQLSSNAWALDGMSDGNLAFGDTGISGDFGRGTSSGGVTRGAIYAFDVGSGDHALGVQPTGSDFVSGAHILKVVNNTGLIVSSVDVSYEILVYNDQDRSNSFNFGYSTDSLSYTPVPALDFDSPDSADASPAWTLTNRNTTLPDTLYPGEELYLKWTGDDVSGSGSRDEFALDDIEVVFHASSACTPPSTAASNVFFNSVKDTSVEVHWTRGNGDSVLVVAKEASSMVSVPVNGTAYSASANYGTGDDLGSGNFAVYSGTSTAVTIKGLAPATEYGILVYEMSSTDTCYAAAAGKDTVTDCNLADDPTGVSASRGDMQVEITWNNGECHDSVLVIASDDSVATLPSGGNSGYMASAVYANGTNTTGNEYVVYNGTGGQVTVTGLTNDTTYFFKVFNSKGQSWSSGVEVSATPLPVAAPGDLIITEIMQNPDSVNDPRGEYFEIYNNTASAIHLDGYRISDAGTNNHELDSGYSVPAFDFFVFARDSASSDNGGFKADYQWSSFTVGNGDDQIYLLNSAGDTVDKVEYDDGSTWPDPTGAAMVYAGSVTDDNNDPANWTTATKREPGFMGLSGDFGSPGTNGHDQLVDFMVYRNGNWTTPPSSSTASQNAVVVSGENASLNTAGTVNKFVVQPGATVDLDSNVLEVLDTMIIEADSTGYAQVIGEVNGWVTHQSYVASTKNARWFNVAFPVSSILDSVASSGGDFLNTLDDAGNDTGQVNIWYYDAGEMNPGTSEGTWKPVADKTHRTEGTGFSVYLGAPHFGALPEKINATGKLINGTQSIDLNTSLSPNQYNFIPNPFPSTIDWDKVVTANPTINKTYYIFDDGKDSTYVGYNAQAGNPPANATPVTQYIAPGQAFFVNANSQSSISLEQDARTLTATPQLYQVKKADGIFLVATTEDDRVDYTYLGFLPSAQDTYNSRVDGMKRMNRATATPSISTYFGGQHYMYKFINPGFAHKTVPVHLQLEVSKDVTIEADFRSIDPSWTVSLEDLETGSMTDLRQRGYSFRHSKPGKQGRFLLHINQSGIGVPDENSSGEIFAHYEEGELIVHLEGYVASPVTLDLYDLSGRLVMQEKTHGGNPVNLSMEGLSAGIYILKLSDRERHIYTQKIIKP